MSEEFQSSTLGVTRAGLSKEETLGSALRMFSTQTDLEELTILSPEDVPVGVLPRAVAFRLSLERCDPTTPIANVSSASFSRMSIRDLPLLLSRNLSRDDFPLVLLDETGRYAGTVFWAAYLMARLDTQLDETRFALSQLEAVFDNAYEGLFMVDGNGIVTYFNQSMSSIFGIPRETAIGRHIAELIPNARLHIVLKTGQPEVGVYRLKDRELVVKRVPIKEKGEVIAAVGTVIFKDVQEVRELSSRLNVLERHIELYKLELEKVWSSKYTFEHILGKSEGISAAKGLAERASQTASPVLIFGESGTGKELFAHAIHFASPRRGKPFIRVDCSSIPAELLESELFGHEAGAFTGALRSPKPGKFELANHGTIFLDEIGNMPLDMQAKLLRVLQEKEVVRVGGTRPIPLDFRVIAATHEDLEQRVHEGAFREDLFYRLDVIRVRVPPLRERHEDFPLLVTHLLDICRLELGLGPIEIDQEALRALSAYAWPGNVRQLANVLERIVTGLKGNTIRVDDLPEFLTAPGLGSGKGHGLAEAVRAIEVATIKAAIEKAQGDVTEASKILGMSRSALYKKLRRLHMETHVSKARRPESRKP